jgi:hypothetical protein
VTPFGAYVVLLCSRGWKTSDSWGISMKKSLLIICLNIFDRLRLSLTSYLAAMNGNILCHGDSMYVQS